MGACFIVSFGWGYLNLLFGSALFYAFAFYFLANFSFFIFNF